MSTRNCLRYIGKSVKTYYKNKRSWDGVRRSSYNCLMTCTAVFLEMTVIQIVTYAT